MCGVKSTCLSKAIQIQIFLNYYGSQSKHMNLDPGQLVATPKIKKNGEEREKRAREKGWGKGKGVRETDEIMLVDKNYREA